jgi:hypothetical protein
MFRKRQNIRKAMRKGKHAHEKSDSSATQEIEDVEEEEDAVLLETWQENVEDKRSEIGEAVESESVAEEELDVRNDQSEDELMVGDETEGVEVEINIDDQDQVDAEASEEPPTESPLESPSAEDTSDASSNSDDSLESPRPQRQSSRNRTKKAVFTYDKMGGNPTFKR